MIEKDDLERKCPKCGRVFCTISVQGVCIDTQNHCLHCQYKDQVKEDGSVDVSETQLGYLESTAKEREDAVGKIAVNCIACAHAGDVQENCTMCRGRGWLLVDKIMQSD